VSRHTRLDELMERFNTRSQAKFYVQRSRENVLAEAGVAIYEAQRTAEAEYHDYELEHHLYYNSLNRVRGDLERLGKVHMVDRTLVPNYLFAPEDIVVTVGQDGLVANTAKYALNLPIIGVNPDPARFDGVLLPFLPADAAEAVHTQLRERAKIRQVTLAEARLNDGQRLLAFNDLFIGARSHVSARYKIQLGKAVESHSSSGVLVSTGAGSTGWLSSVFNMVAGVSQFTAGHKMQQGKIPAVQLKWEDPHLVFIVREPFVSKMSSAKLVAGLLENRQHLSIESFMPTNGVIFSDGVEADFLTFNSGATAEISAAKEHALLVVK
jgi:NAD kinase